MTIKEIINEAISSGCDTRKEIMRYVSEHYPSINLASVGYHLWFRGFRSNPEKMKKNLST